MITVADIHPNETAQRLTGRDYLSWSAISCYQSCPLKHFFHYVARLPEATVSAALVYGSGIHRAIERHFRELFAGNEAPPADILLAEFMEEWKSRDLEQIRFGKDEDLDSLTRLAQRTLVAFQQSEISRPQGRLLAVEEELRGLVVAGCPEVLARVDLIMDTGRELLICDWKTARSRWSQDQVDDACTQLLLYSELVQDFAPGMPIRLEFVILTKTKGVVIDRHTRSVDPAQVARTKRVVENVWRAIQAGSFYPAPSAMNCPGCPYRDACRSWAG